VVQKHEYSMFLQVTDDVFTDNVFKYFGENRCWGNRTEVLRERSVSFYKKKWNMGVPPVMYPWMIGISCLQLVLTQLHTPFRLLGSVTSPGALLVFKSCSNLIFTDLRPAQEFFPYMETSPLPMKGSLVLSRLLLAKIYGDSRGSGCTRLGEGLQNLGL
jgi:hypothetical protein